MQSSNSNLSEITQWLIERQDSYSLGVAGKKQSFPWIFVLKEDSALAKPIIEAAIVKGLKKELNKQAFILSPEEFYQKYSSRVCFADAMVWVGVHPEGIKQSTEDIESFHGVPFCWISEVNDSEESKRELWNYLKELRFYAS